MGNNSSRERRHQSSGTPDGSHAGRQQHNSPAPNGGDSGRGSRRDLSIFGLGPAAPDGTEPRRETKPEREARRLERERAIRAKERERSMREEHVDGGYLVTQGVYTGPEDFNRGIVRQFMIERRIAPFWRGLNDFNEEWTEHQLVAAAKGLPIPPADEVPTDSPSRPATSSAHSTTVPVPIQADPFTSNSPSTALSYQSSLHPAAGQAQAQNSSPFRPRSKTIASLTSKNPSQSDIVPREIQLPFDPYVNGLRLEAFLYKDAAECPICFIYYPPYLNKTRCCDQAICSECFVQIKRPDPHVPEQHGDSNPTTPPEETPGTLVSEPANCPYCQQPEFGVTYEPPPFRRGLAYANMASPSYDAANASETSVDGTSGLSPASGNRRRAASVSANASNVITTDKIRPDWATKLANARNHAARRAAAATALHTAAYLMNNDNRGFSSRGRFFSRREGESSSGPIGLGADSPGLLGFPQGGQGQEGAAGPRRRSRIDDLEEMMMMEAIRLSIAAEEERKRKEDKEKAKEEKKKAKEQAKEQKKADKAASKGVYGEGSSRSGSALSLILPGRRRGNSGSSLLARGDGTPAGKGKGVDRSTEGTASSSQGDLAGTDGAPSSTPPYGQHLGATNTGNIQEGSSPAPHSTAPDRPTHLRHMSTASSQSSYNGESGTPSNAPSVRRGLPGSSSYGTQNASGVSLNRDRDDPGSAGSEPMFNFRRLADEVEREDKEDGIDDYRVEYANSSRPASSFGPPGAIEDLEQSTATLRVSESGGQASGQSASGEKAQAPEAGKLEVKTDTPGLMVTPVTPTAGPGADEDKQLGH